MFASKNVTTTNININVTKTTTRTDDEQTISDYSKNINISSIKENSTIATPASTLEFEDEEIEIEPVKENANNFSGLGYNPIDENDEFDNQDDYDEDNDDIDEEIDASHIKDEAPKGGLEDLLKALLDD